jgi:gluconolactonase
MSQKPARGLSAVRERIERVLQLASALALVIAVLPSAARAQATPSTPAVNPDSVVDLRTGAGLALIDGQWRYSDASVADVPFRSAGPDRKPSGPVDTTYAVQPAAATPGFDDSTWEKIAPETLEERRGPGKVSFNWYSLHFTVPQRLGQSAVAGDDVVFEIVVDDYSEIAVDGKLAPTLGQVGGGVIAGWNAPNRVVVAHDVRPGQTFTITVFGINGPVSLAPENYIWVRSATLDFFKPDKIERVARDGVGKILRVGPALDSILAPDAKIEKVATGFEFTEGPVWVRDGNYLLFSDPNANMIYRWSPGDGQVSIYRAKSGYAGTDIGEFVQPGSNGLTLDARGRLTVDEMGRRRVTRIEPNGTVTVLADNYRGKRFNSPNDLVYRSDGALYFTDPPFGLPKVFDDPRKELPYSGVFCVIDGAVKLVSTDFTGPNGLAFSPDEKYLYVDDWDAHHKAINRYEVRPNGDLANGKLWADLTNEPGEDALDGMKVDKRGNVYVAGPSGLWIFSPGGQVIGRIVPPEEPHNLTWGDADGKTLYIAALTSIYRVRFNVEGIRP